MNGMKKVIYMLEDEIEKISQKGDINPSDLQQLKDASKSLYYLTVTCAMKEGEDSSEYGRRPYYNNYGEDEYGRRSRDSRGRYMDGGSNYNDGRSYGHYDLKEKKMYLEEMLREARSDSEREMLRRKIEEVERSM